MRCVKIALAALVLSACQQSKPQEQSAPSAQQNFGPTEAPRPTLPPTRARTVDPKSTDAAEDPVRSFARLLNERKFDQAFMLLGPSAPPRAEFDQQFTGYQRLDVSLGQAGDQDGAAGSIYLSVPLTVSGETRGRKVTRNATAILRRVNDVPGSTDAQRHWHIERIDWGNAD